MDIDPTSRAGARLATELIAWLTTVSPAGQPQPSPVWFLWQGGDVLVYSLQDTARNRNIAGNDRVALNLDGNGTGGDIVVVEGRAGIDEDALPADQVPDYVAKYRGRMDANGWTPEWFAARYPVAIRIRPTRLRSW